MANDVYHIVCTLDKMIDQFHSENMHLPKELVLPLRSRAALQFAAASKMNKEVWNLPDITEYRGIPVIKVEEILIIKDG